MIVDALVGFGYPFGDLRKMTASELMQWLDVAIARVKRSHNSGA